MITKNPFRLLKTNLYALEGMTLGMLIEEYPSFEPTAEGLFKFLWTLYSDMPTTWSEFQQKPEDHSPATGKFAMHVETQTPVVVLDHYRRVSYLQWHSQCEEFRVGHQTAPGFAKWYRTFKFVAPEPRIGALLDKLSLHSDVQFRYT
jgi:hypothetical protein